MAVVAIASISLALFCALESYLDSLGIAMRSSSNMEFPSESDLWKNHSSTFLPYTALHVLLSLAVVTAGISANGIVKGRIRLLVLSIFFGIAGYAFLFFLASIVAIFLIAIGAFSKKDFESETIKV